MGLFDSLVDSAANAVAKAMIFADNLKNPEDEGFVGWNPSDEESIKHATEVLEKQGRLDQPQTKENIDGATDKKTRWLVELSNRANKFIRGEKKALDVNHSEYISLKDEMLEAIREYSIDKEDQFYLKYRALVKCMKSDYVPEDVQDIVIEKCQIDNDMISANDNSEP